MHQITLTPEEYCCAVYHGIYLRQISVYDGRRDNVSARDLEEEKKHADKVLALFETFKETGEFSKEGLLPEYNKGANNGLRIQVIGAIAELAGAKFTGTGWHRTANRFKKADCSNDIEVRLIGKEDYDLRIKPNDKDHFRVLGVLIPVGEELGTYNVVGWVPVSKGKRFPLRDPHWKFRPFHSVPQSELLDPTELLAIIKKEGLKSTYTAPTLKGMYINTLEKYIKSKQPPDIACDRCEQPAGEFCVTKKGKRTKTHKVRIVAVPSG